MSPSVSRMYELARDHYLEYGVDTEKALQKLASISISLHCWQGDDVTGLEGTSEKLSGGIMATGAYPGKARNGDELRTDIERAFKHIAGKHRVNLHAMYAETNGTRVERNALRPEHFSRWLDWAKSHGLKLDFNPSFFSHPKAASGFTLSDREESVRNYWIEHAIVCRKIGEYFGKELESPCVTNIWIPDGSKDVPADRLAPRARLAQSLERIFAERTDTRWNRDALESKLFGIGSESYVVGSHDFYVGHALRYGAMICIDMGHFHPTESVADKISATLTWSPELLLHISRGIRWDSDHVVILNDEVRAVAEEIVEGGFLDRVHISLDYFDASINRIAAWVIGMRSLQKALLGALLKPTELLREHENRGDNTSRLALMEEAKSLPAGAVWDYFCEINNVPVGKSWIEEVKKSEKPILEQRS